MAYEKHNLIIDNGYEIFRNDGSLRASSFTDNKAEAEGTFKVEVRDKNGDLKSCEEKPVRSFQKGMFYTYFPQKNTPTSIETSHKISNCTNWTYQNNSFFGNYGATGGICLCNRTGSAPSRTYSKVDCSCDSNTYTRELSAPHFNQTDNTVDLSFYREAVPLAAGAANTAALSLSSTGMTPTGTGSDGDGRIALADTISASWQANDSIKVTYNISIPTSSTATITKNFIIDLFSEIFLSSKFVNNEGTEIAPIRKGTTSSSKANNAKPIVHPDFTADTSTGAANKGIVIGSSDLSLDDDTVTGVKWDDYRLKSQFLGSAVEYSSSSWQNDYLSYQQSGNKFYAVFARNFRNISGSDITIKEAGIYSYCNDTTNSVATAGSFLLSRWLTGDVVVHDGETIRVYWKPAIVVS